jgi:predicted dithiol-disulfide oxidoreductase (DUF899 family)
MQHAVVSRSEWLDARKHLLDREKALTGLKGRDEASLEFTQSWVRHHDRYGG